MEIVIDLDLLSLEAEEKKRIGDLLENGANMIYVGSFSGDPRAEMRHEAMKQAAEIMGLEIVPEKDNDDSVWALILQEEKEEFETVQHEIWLALKSAEENMYEN